MVGLNPVPCDFSVSNSFFRSFSFQLVHVPFSSFGIKNMLNVLPYPHVCVLVGICLDSGLLKGPSWNVFITTGFSVRSPRTEKKEVFCVCIRGSYAATCSLSFHSGWLSGAFPGLMRCSNTQRHMYYVYSNYTESSPVSCVGIMHFTLKNCFRKVTGKTKTTVT